MNPEPTFARTASTLFQLALIIAAIGLLLICSGAFACAPVMISVDLATKNTDGTTLTNATGQRLYYGQDSQNLSNTLDVPFATNIQTPCLDGGKWFFAMTTLTATAESARNTGASVDVPFALLTSDTVLYKQTQGVNGFTMVAVGTIALKSPCNGAHEVDGFTLLPSRDSPDIVYKSAYIKQPGLKPQSVYAKCAMQ
jgi:hypothetical protein